MCTVEAKLVAVQITGKMHMIYSHAQIVPRGNWTVVLNEWRGVRVKCYTKFLLEMKLFVLIIRFCKSNIIFWILLLKNYKLFKKIFNFLNQDRIKQNYKLKSNYFHQKTQSYSLNWKRHQHSNSDSRSWLFGLVKRFSLFNGDQHQFEQFAIDQRVKGQQSFPESWQTNDQKRAWVDALFREKSPPAMQIKRARTAFPRDWTKSESIGTDNLLTGNWKQEVDIGMSRYRFFWHLTSSLLRKFSDFFENNIFKNFEIKTNASKG